MDELERADSDFVIPPFLGLGGFNKLGRGMGYGYGVWGKKMGD